MKQVPMILVALAASAIASARGGAVIVQLAPGADPAAVAKKANVVLLDTTPNAPFAYYGVISGSADAAQKVLAADNKEVLWAEDDQSLRSTEDVSKGSSLSVIGDRTTMLAADANALAQVDWSSSLAASDGRTVKIAILDTGLSKKQTALWANVDASMDVFGGNADDAPKGIDSNGDGVKDSGVGHGTMVAGIVNAVAPKVRLLIGKIADSDGQASAWGLIKGIAFATVNGAEIANVSMGSPDNVAAFNDVAEWATGKGLLVVAAIGNANTSKAWNPSASSKAVCVAGLASDDTKASFSNWDSAADACAPSVGIISEFWDGNLAVWSGTSFAAPFVAGAIADCLRRSTVQKPQKLIQMVTDSGRDVSKGNKNYQGKLGTALDIVSLDKKIRSSKA